MQKLFIQCFQLSISVQQFCDRYHKLPIDINSLTDQDIEWQKIEITNLLNLHDKYQQQYLDIKTNIKNYRQQWEINHPNQSSSHIEEKCNTYLQIHSNSLLEQQKRLSDHFHYLDIIQQCRSIQETVKVWMPITKNRSINNKKVSPENTQNIQDTLQFQQQNFQSLLLMSQYLPQDSPLSKIMHEELNNTHIKIAEIENTYALIQLELEVKKQNEELQQKEKIKRQQEEDQLLQEINDSSIHALNQEEELQQKSQPEYQKLNAQFTDYKKKYQKTQIAIQHSEQAINTLIQNQTLFLQDHQYNTKEYQNLLSYLIDICQQHHQLLVQCTEDNKQHINSISSHCNAYTALLKKDAEELKSYQIILQNDLKKLISKTQGTIDQLNNAVPLLIAPQKEKQELFEDMKKRNLTLQNLALVIHDSVIDHNNLNFPTLPDLIQSLTQMHFQSFSRSSRVSNELMLASSAIEQQKAIYESTQHQIYYYEIHLNLFQRFQSILACQKSPNSLSDSLQHMSAEQYQIFKKENQKNIQQLQDIKNNNNTRILEELLLQEELYFDMLLLIQKKHVQEQKKPKEQLNSLSVPHVLQQQLVASQTISKKDRLLKRLHQLQQKQYQQYRERYQQCFSNQKHLQKYSISQFYQAQIEFCFSKIEAQKVDLQEEKIADPQ